MAAVGGAPILAAAATNPIVQSLVGDSLSTVVNHALGLPNTPELIIFGGAVLPVFGAAKRLLEGVFSLPLITSLSNR